MDVIASGRIGSGNFGQRGAGSLRSAALKGGGAQRVRNAPSFIPVMAKRRGPAARPAGGTPTSRRPGELDERQGHRPRFTRLLQHRTGRAMGRFAPVTTGVQRVGRVPTWPVRRRLAQVKIWPQSFDIRPPPPSAGCTCGICRRDLRATPVIPAAELKDRTTCVPLLIMKPCDPELSAGTCGDRGIRAPTWS